MAVLDLFLVWMMKDSYLGSGIYVFFLFLMGIQLTALRKLHSESFWLTVYPLPEGSKGKERSSLYSGPIWSWRC